MSNDRQLSCFLPNKFKNYFIAIATLAAAIGNSCPTLAQITPDTSLGDKSSVVTPDVEVKGESADRIDGGAIRDRNLFHSFDEFNVDAGQRVYFANPANIEQIFTRVTGSNASNIDGTLGVLKDTASHIGGAADLLLLNPNGIIFGENSSLDLEGSFFGTSADSVLFEDDAEFSAAQPNLSLLTVSIPVGLQMGDNPGSISVRSPLTIADGQNFSLVGGEINLKGNDVNTDEDGINSAADGIIAPGGRVELGGLSTAGIVSFEDNSNLVFPENVSRADINLNNYFINASAGGGGFITLQSENFKLTDSFLVTGINSNAESTAAQAGNITIDTDEATIIEATDNSQSGILNTTGGNITGDLSEEFDLDPETRNLNTTNVSGNAGNIFINTDSLLAEGAFVINSLTNGEGNAGSININAKSSVRLDLLKPLDFSNLSSIAGIISGVGELGTGNSADIEINASSLSAENVSISTSTTGAGNAGNTKINANNVDANNSLIISDTTSSGNGGNVQLNVKSLSAENVNISTSTTDAGNAGNTKINATDSVDFVNTLVLAETFSSGDAGNIIFESATTDISLSATVISTRVSQPMEEFVGTGRGGDINIKGRNLTVSQNAVITTFTGGQVTADGLANAGDIELDISDSILVNINSELFTSTIGEGNAGNLTINTEEITIENSLISAANSGSGQAGNLNITASKSIDLNGTYTDLDGTVLPAGLFTSTVGGEANAGDLTISTGFLKVSNAGQILASTEGTGNAGNITIEADEIQLTGNFSGDIGTGIGAVSGNAGDGGIIDITASNLEIEDGARISVRSAGDGNAGSIFARINDSVELENGAISSRSDRSSGGEIEIAAGDIRLRGDSNIQTSVENGAGGGGNITLSADSIVAFDDSDIFAFAADGVGGNITLDTDAFFATNYSPTTLDANPQLLDNNSRVDINASGLVFGIVDIPDVNFLPNSLVELSEDTIDVDEVVANSCVVRSGQGGTFIVTGSDGLRSRPGDPAAVDYATGAVRSIGDRQPQANTEDSWQSGDPIVEPEKAYRLSNGKLVLSRGCNKN